MCKNVEGGGTESELHSSYPNKISSWEILKGNFKVVRMPNDTRECNEVKKTMSFCSLGGAYTQIRLKGHLSNSAIQKDFLSRWAMPSRCYNDEDPRSGTTLKGSPITTLK